MSGVVVVVRSPTSLYAGVANPRLSSHMRLFAWFHAALTFISKVVVVVVVVVKCASNLQCSFSSLHANLDQEF